jgi:tetratricopeptide (TPR) repeat protein
MIGKAALFLFASAILVRADPAADQLTAAGIAEFSAAYQGWDAVRFGNAAELFRQAELKTPASATNPYWRGAALFHRMLRLKSTPDPKAASAAMDAAVSSLETAVKSDMNHAESHALLGTLYGMKIDGNLLRAMRYGPAVQDHQQQALKYGPTNPRVRYLLGTGQFHTAKDAATRREALNTLLAAEKLFDAEARQPVKEFEPRWGYSSCLTFIARTYESLGQKTEAETYYRRALAAHPADHVAKQGLQRLKEK